MRKHKWMLIILVFLTLIQSISMAFGNSISSSTNQLTKFHFDSSLSGYASGNGLVNSFKPFWNYTAGAAVVSSTAVVYGCVFVGCKDYNIYCLNVSNGQLVRNFTIGGEVDSSPAVYNGVVIVATGDFFVHLNSVTAHLDPHTFKRLANSLHFEVFVIERKRAHGKQIKNPSKLPTAPPQHEEPTTRNNSW